MDGVITNKSNEKLGLKEFADRHPMSLSGGQKQRVAVASAVLLEKGHVADIKISGGNSKDGKEKERYFAAV